MVHGTGNWCKDVEGSYYSRIVKDSGNPRNSIQCSASESNKLVEHSLLSCVLQMCNLNCDNDDCASDGDGGEKTTTTYRRLRRRLTRAEAAWNMAEEALSQAERSAWRAAHPLRTCRCAAGRHNRSTPICMVPISTRSSNPRAWWLPDCERRCGVRNLIETKSKSSKRDLKDENCWWGMNIVATQRCQWHAYIANSLAANFFKTSTLFLLFSVGFVFVIICKHICTWSLIYLAWFHLVHIVQ